MSENININNNDIILTSRVRLARNLSDYPFVTKLNNEQSKEILDIFRNLTGDIKTSDNLKMSFIDLSSMKQYEKAALIEQHILSPEMMNENISRGLILSQDQKTSILINEEDHLRIQHMENGLNLYKCFEIANEADDSIESKVKYAFDETLGYLTCCPTNVGTGMRASVMLHLPALSQTNRIENLIHSLSTLGIVFRGIYGEGSDFKGHIFQISNQVTLGVEEKATIELINTIALDIANREKECRNKLYKANKFEFEDRIMRSLGIFKNAVKMTSAEALKLISDIRLGASMGIIKDIEISKLNKLMQDIMPASITKNYNITDSLERDIKRCEIIKDTI